MIKVMVVDDSAFMRKMLSDLIEQDGRIQVIATARNGVDALEKISKYNPDVITLDVEMPVMNGIEALKNIMARHPKPVIMVSSTTKEGADTTIQAMEFGAFDFIPKPSGSISLDIYKVQNDLNNKIVHAARTPLKILNKSNENNITTETDPNRLIESTRNFVVRENNNNLPLLDSRMIVAIGTSTGGPKALQKILPEIREDFPAPILIVQHMPKGFTKSLSERLNKLSNITVKEAEDGEILKKGIAYIAPGGYHLKVRGVGTSVVVKLDQSPLMNGHRPSVDTMFYSLAQLKDQDVLAVILTGMGSDGTKGLKVLKESNKTIALAESEATAIVYGMPRAAIESKYVDDVVTLNKVATTIEKYSI
ncbi:MULTISPECIES: protein-glutamate methylesterase/protein-glutamine glutaminase [Bacillaceae]|uniref:Protein-glutamate methylesterase/protein-glutamine glutaminase n=1 Tax=Evansella alkalicola TaxID=745819 RepID=A0ABS6JP42_9BACI|nr:MULTISPECIES: chemotaxis response regulator protein-glutamate methylesterase [Bacillaceae]MBU9720339.1 chemotaxis response regulator protein-glutamate methylesterase [Bacillus alkalicola]